MAGIIRAILSFILGSFGGSNHGAESQQFQAHHAEHKIEANATDLNSKKDHINLDISLDKQEIAAVKRGEKTDEQIIKDAQLLIADLEARAQETGHRTQELTTIENLLKQITNQMLLDKKKREELIATLREEMTRSATEAALLTESARATDPKEREQDQKAIAQEEAVQEKEEKKEQQLELELDSGSGI